MEIDPAINDIVIQKMTLAGTIDAHTTYTYNILAYLYTSTYVH
jgi:hypothetical protein